MSKKTIVPLIGAGEPQKNLTSNPQRIINYYPVLGPSAAQNQTQSGSSNPKTPISLNPTPGTYLKVPTPNNGEIRALLTVNSVVYVVSGNILYAMGITNNFLSLGTLNTFTGKVTLLGNWVSGVVQQIMVLDGINGYVYNGLTGVFGKITDPSFPNPAPNIGTYQNGRAIIPFPNSTKVCLSNLNDFTTYNANAFFFASNDPQNVSQNITGICATSTDLYIFKGFTTEPWVLTNSDPIQPYQLRPGVILDQGSVSPFSICRADSTVIWLSQNEQGQALLVSSYYYRPVKILDEGDQYQITQLPITGSIIDAEAFVFQKEGHTFYEITFPTNNISFLYDIQTHKMVQIGSWYVSGTDSQGMNNYSLGRHLSRCHALFNGQNIVGDYRGGNLLVLDENTYTDYNCGTDGSIYREVTSGILSDNKNRLFLISLELDCDTGEIPLTATSAANVVFDVSYDGGHSYAFSKIVALGLTGAYKQRVKANGFGNSRDLNIRVHSTCNCKMGINKLIAELIEGNA